MMDSVSLTPTKWCKKIGFADRKVARKIKRLLQLKHHKTFTIYYCDLCQAYHFTSMDKQKSRQMQKNKQYEQNN